MTSGKEHRRFPRYSNPEIPIRLKVPVFATDRLIPRDVSMGGFMVTEIPTRPGIGGLFDCAIEIENQVFEGCQVKVVWMMENEANPTSWSVGLSLRKPDDHREEIDSALLRVFSILGG